LIPATHAPMASFRIYLAAQFNGGRTHSLSSRREQAAAPFKWMMNLVPGWADT